MLRLIVAIMILCASSVATAQTTPSLCGKTASVFDALKTKYGEEPIWWGLSANGMMVTLTATDENEEGKSSFTITESNPSGMTCVRSAGSDWDILEFKRAIEE